MKETNMIYVQPQIKLAFVKAHSVLCSSPTGTINDLTENTTTLVIDWQ